MIFSDQVLLAFLLTFLAGGATAFGSLLSLMIRRFRRRYLAFGLGFSAGVMIYISFVELLSTSITNIGFIWANLAFFMGMLFSVIIDFLIPHQYINESCQLNPANKKLMTAGVFTAIGIAIHNFPEGLAVFANALSDFKLAIPLALAIAIHNIPEGISVAMPIFYATRSRRKAFYWSLFSGASEPLGAMLGFLFLSPFLTLFNLQFILAFVAGVMVFISFDELLPLCFENCRSHYSIAGIVSGMMIMGLSLAIL